MSLHPPQTKQAPVSFAASGDNAVIAHLASGQIHIYGLIFTTGGATNITFKSGSNARSGPFVFTGNGSSMTLYLNDEPWYVCESGSDFIMNSTAAVQVSGTVWYRA